MANVWKKFSDLLPKKKITIGTVNSIDSTNKTSTVTLIDNSQIKVFGTSVQVGDNCFIEDNRIVGEAPNLSIIQISIV